MNFYEKKKVGFGILMKNVQDARFSRKKGGNAGSGHRLPDPDYRFPFLSRMLEEDKINLPKKEIRKRSVFFFYI